MIGQRDMEIRWLAGTIGGRLLDAVVTIFDIVPLAEDDANAAMLVNETDLDAPPHLLTVRVWSTQSSKAKKTLR